MRSVWILALFLSLIVETTFQAPVSGTNSTSNSSECESPNLACQTGECIPIKRICDEIFDCSDGEDEMNCSSEEECPPEYSPCANEYCVLNMFICDGENDCLDGSDEVNCEDQQSNYSCSSSDSFVCKTTKENEQKVCISQNSTCNGIKECPLGDDEENCDDIKSCAVQEHKCQHFCEDRPESFVCGCAEGYKLDSDGRSCKYENEASSAGYLLASNGPEIHQFSLANLHDKTNHTIAHETELGSVRNMDYMRQDDKLFMMMMFPHSGQRISDLAVFSNGRMKTLRENIIGGVSIAVDWIGKNVFLTQNFGTSIPGISACTMDGLFCRRIIEAKSENITYFGLVVHPMRGLIFWIESYNKSSHIMMSNMDGSDVRFVIDTNNKTRHTTPTTLAIDHINNDVYFINYDHNLVERINIDTKERQVVFSHEHLTALGMVYLNGFLYWTDWIEKSLMVQEVSHNHSSPHVVPKFKYMPPLGLAVNHSLHQIEPSSNPCHELDCPWLCIIIPKSSSGGITAKCICPDGYTPSGDTCIPFSPFDEMEILKNYSHIGFELMSEYCKRRIGCKNGGSCRQLSNETRIVCDCELPFDGQYCERINPEKHAAMKEFSTQFSALAFLFIIVLVLLIVGCGALVRMAKRKLKVPSSKSPLVTKLRKVFGKEEKASSKVNFVNGESGIRIENSLTSFNNPLFDETPISSSSASFSTIIRFEDDGSLL